MLTTLHAENEETYLIGKQISENRAFEWGFGRNQDGELSLGVAKKNALVPASATGLREVSTRQIASSSNHTICITSHGALYFTGSKLHGKVGKNSSTTRTSKFQLQSSLNMHRIRAVACNDYVTLCLLENATVLTIGGAHDYEPKPLPALAGMQVIQIDCGEKHCAAVDQNGDLYTWGGMSAQYNKGQLGHGNNKGVEQPARVKALENHRIMRVACGGYHTIVLTAGNLLFGFGSN